MLLEEHTTSFLRRAVNLLSSEIVGTGGGGGGGSSVGGGGGASSSSFNPKAKAEAAAAAAGWGEPKSSAESPRTTGIGCRIAFASYTHISSRPPRAH